MLGSVISILAENQSMKKLLLLPLYVCLAVVSHGASIALEGFAPAALTSGNSLISWTNTTETGTVLTDYSITFTLTNSTATAGDKALYGSNRIGNGGSEGLCLNLTVGSGGVNDCYLSLQTKSGGVAQSIQIEGGATSLTSLKLDLALSITMVYHEGFIELYNGSTLVGSAAIVHQDMCNLQLGVSSFWTNGGTQRFGSVSGQKLDALPVPEPSAASLGLLGISALLFRRRK